MWFTFSFSRIIGVLMVHWCLFKGCFAVTTSQLVCYSVFFICLWFLISLSNLKFNSFVPVLSFVLFFVLVVCVAGSTIMILVMGRAVTPLLQRDNLQ